MNSSSKPFFKSKTLWVNIVAIVVIILESVAANQGVITDILSPEMATIILAGINIVLRTITKVPVTIKASGD